MARETKEEKAERFVEQHRAIAVDEQTAIVIGDSGTYELTKNAWGWRCDCKFGGTDERPCSHVLAARAVAADPRAREHHAPLVAKLLGASRIPSAPTPPPPTPRKETEAELAEMLNGGWCPF